MSENYNAGKNLRKHVKIEVALEILSLCIAKSFQENAFDEFYRLNVLKEQIYKGKEKTANLVLEQYGTKLKDIVMSQANLEGTAKKGKDYFLTQEEFEKMNLTVHMLTLQNIKPEKGRPTAIVIGGQPGAGKSGIVLKTKRDFSRKKKESVLLDLDIYRGLYKNAIEIAKKQPSRYTEITNSAVGKIMEKLSETVIQKGYNLIFEGTMGKSIYTIDILQQSDKNYKIIARLMAVSREESILSMFERYLEMKYSIGIGRLTTIEDHDIRYKNFPNIANTLEDRGIEVEVYERSADISNPKMTYKTSSNNNIYKSVNDALMAGRRKSYDLCKSNAKERILNINHEMRIIGDDKLLADQLHILNSIYF